MNKQILVIGGTRLFGIRLVLRLLDAGHQVTIATRGRAGDPFGDRVRRTVVDRCDLDAMAAAFAGRAGYDVVYDQMCYRASDAAISLAVFAGRVRRYVMASTIEVYRDRYGALARPFVEDDVVLEDAAPALDEADYAAGKRGAEARLARDATFPVVRVRIGHVLAGPEDFTGRLASYVQTARDGAALRHAASAAPTSFIGVDEISALLAWVGDQRFVGALNAASHAWSAVELHRRVAATLGRPAILEPVVPSAEPAQLSPFDYASPYQMSTARARSLGYRFAADEGWLDDAIRRHAVALAH